MNERQAASSGIARVLLVCERWPERALLRAALLEEGMKVVGARDLYEGLARMEAEQFDLVVVDLPCSGQKALRTLREKWPRTPLLLLSGPFACLSLTPEDGPPEAHLLERPFRVEDLIRRVRIILGE
ncbi:MAG: hypothetical protein ACUVXG_13585 [Anaerolineae bacterium]